MEEQSRTSFQELLNDYPSLTKGLKKLGITSPLDLQEQILNLPNQIDNLIITAPQQSGKKLALLLLSMRRFMNQEQGTLLFIAHSKDLSQDLTSLLSVISRTTIINLFMQRLQTITKKCILVGSPLQFVGLSKEVKDTVTGVVVVEADYLFGFGYGVHLENLACCLPGGVIYQISCIKIGPELQEFKSKWMKKGAKINYKPPTQPQEPKFEKTDGQAVHFYEVGEKNLLPIALYVTLKFGLVNPKVLILVETLKDVYRYNLFLDRCKVPSIGLYNHQNPVNLKFYSLSLWMNGPTNILISTSQIYTDLQTNIFKQNCTKNFKRETFSLQNLATVVCINLSHVQKYYTNIFNYFNHKPFIMTFVENCQKQVQCLQRFVKMQAQMFEVVKSKEFPISKKELEAFQYRVNDVMMSLGPYKVQLYQKYDFKKKILKSPDMQAHFTQNPKQKQLLLTQIKSLKQRINKQTVTMSQHIPSYLVPQCLKSAYQQKQKQIQKQAKSQEIPKYLQKVRNAVKHVDLEEEDPEIMDVSRLKLISARKRWKLQHGFKLKRKNIRKERKGIFQG